MKVLSDRDRKWLEECPIGWVRQVIHDKLTLEPKRHVKRGSA